MDMLFGTIVGTVSELTGFDREVSFGRGSEHVGEAIEGEQRFWAIPYDVQSVVAGNCNSKAAKAVKPRRGRRSRLNHPNRRRRWEEGEEHHVVKGGRRLLKGGVREG
jgi:hypothetical protein